MSPPEPSTRQFSSADSPLTRAADALGKFAARVVPSAFSIAIILALASFMLAAIFAEGPVHARVARAVKGFGDGFWELLAFSMQMALVVFTGYLLALSAPVTRLLTRVASFARTPRAAVVLMSLASMALAYVNWGLSIVASAMLVRFVVKRQPEVDYRLLVACAYFGLGATWHAGLSASAPLLVATPKHFLVAEMGVVPTSQTLFSPFNLTLVVLVTALLTALAYFMHPPKGRAVTVDPALFEREVGFSPPPKPTTASPAEKLDHMRALSLVFSAVALFSVARSLMMASLGAERASALGQSFTAADIGTYARILFTEGFPALITDGIRHLNLNLINFTFFALAVLLHRTPSALIAAAEEASRSLHGIVLQFPLYAGIFGVFRETRLSDILGDAIVSVASERTLPTLVYFYSGLVNYFVPSGGSKWAIEAPYLLKAGAALGVSADRIVLAYAWGDMATDLIQPFWALPLLAVAKIEFKEVMGFLLIAFAIYLPFVTAAFYFFG